jgi:L-amino acid N-acyltransferase YncA
MDESNLKFSEAKYENTQEMLDLYNYYVKTTTITFDLEEISIELFLKRIKIGDAKYKTYACQIGNILIGFCFFIPFRDKPAYQKTVEIGVYLKPEFTGKKYGEKIVKYLEGKIKDNQYMNIIASVSSENNTSIRLFRRLGYEQCASYKEVAYKHGHYVGIIDFQKKV